MKGENVVGYKNCLGDCKLHKDGRCLCMDKPCLAINDDLCMALRSAYKIGLESSISTDGLLPCPFCGIPVFLEKKPMWSTGGRGYFGCYSFVVKCRNLECQCTISLPGNDTVYNSEEEARANAIKAWNKRAK